MTIQTLTISQIQPSVLNPRKFFNDETIEELAQSIIPVLPRCACAERVIPLRLSRS